MEREFHTNNISYGRKPIPETFMLPYFYLMISRGGNWVQSLLLEQVDCPRHVAGTCDKDQLSGISEKLFVLFCLLLGVFRFLLHFDT